MQLIVNQDDVIQSELHHRIQNLEEQYQDLEQVLVQKQSELALYVAEYDEKVEVLESEKEQIQNTLLSVQEEATLQIQNIEDQNTVLQQEKNLLLQRH